MGKRWEAGWKSEGWELEEGWSSQLVAIKSVEVENKEQARSSWSAVADHVVFRWRQKWWQEGEAKGREGGWGGGREIQPREAIVRAKRHTGGGRRKKGEARPGGREFRLEYGGLVLSADSAFGFFGVHQPRGATLGLRVTLLFRNVTLWTQTSAISHYYQRWLN